MSPLSSADNKLHLAVAGTGNPYAYLTPRRLELLRALFDEPDEASVAQAAGLTAAQLEAELQPLATAALLTGPAGYRRPGFFIATAGELPRLNTLARDLGQALAEQLQQRRPLIEEQYWQLSTRQSGPLREQAFFLVGDLILDVGLLDALAAETNLMPPAPVRPSSDVPEAHFYVWLIEGSRALLGKYGQRVTPLPWPNLELRTFGDYWQGGEPNLARLALEERALVVAPDAGSPSTLAEALGIPIFSPADATLWWAFARREARLLAATLAVHEAELRELFAGLRAAQLPGTSFGEFFCWYDHVIYAHAIDELAAAGLIRIPPERFTATIWPTGAASAF